MTGWTVPRLFEGMTLVCIGSGPSLTAEDVGIVQASGHPTIVINDSWLMAPWATILYACDANWWRWHDGVPKFDGLKVGREPVAYPDVHTLDAAGDTGLSTDPTKVATGYNSGYQAINLAVLLGACRIVLLGYDMQPQGRKHHWFPPDGRHGHPRYDRCLEAFETLREPLNKLCVEVVNCTRVTALTTFPQRPIGPTLRTPSERNT